ncbi:hypothetical protein PIB30_014881 [Stylosanthes scabra]|uniref:Uncharacterized protein n=1 Tax=Stylosanthes scabra TaxID=79078 RepID=A0ABU6T8T5_9FABA|nr:hypothetical protein [Stylosanthes scabra]
MAENPGDNQEGGRAEAVRMPHEVSLLYRWVSPDVLGAPSILNQAYFDELKGTGVIFGGGDLERRYKVEAARRGERVCYMNLDHPTKPHWLWVNEEMFTEFGIRVPFTDFQQRLLLRACIAPSQLHPNAWASIRSFELVTEWLQLPQEPEVFMSLFTFYSTNTQGKTKKGYMSVRSSKYRKIFGLFEDSFHDLKGRYFNILPGLRAEQKDTVDILTALFVKNNLAPKALLGRPDEARRDVVSMAGNNVTLNHLRGLVRPFPSAGAAVPTTPVVGHAGSGPSLTARGSAQPAQPTPNVIITPEEGSSNDGGRNAEVASPIREQHIASPSSSRRSMPLETPWLLRRLVPTLLRGRSRPWRSSGMRMPRMPRLLLENPSCLLWVGIWFFLI